MAEVIIYGASDDLLEFDGAIYEELGVGSSPRVVAIESPDGERLYVTAQFGGPLGDWSVGVVAVDGQHPGWPVRFGERPDREGDPAVFIDVPVGSFLVEVDEG